MLRATGQIYHAKNLHSTRSTSKAKGTQFQRASGHVEGGWSGGSSCTFVSWSGRNWQRVFKMRDLVDLGQSSISVNTAALAQSTKTEEESQNMEKLEKLGEPPHTPHLPSLHQKEKKKSCCSKKEIEDEEIDAGATKPSWCVLLCCGGTEKWSGARTDMSPDKDDRCHVVSCHQIPAQNSRLGWKTP